MISTHIYSICAQKIVDHEKRMPLYSRTVSLDSAAPTGLFPVRHIPAVAKAAGAWSPRGRRR